MSVLSNVKVYGLEESVQASKYPMSVDIGSLDSTVTNGVDSRAKAEKGTGHDVFLTGIVVQFDLTFSVEAWAQAERYHFLDFVSSQSKMHKCSSFDIAKQCNEWVLPEQIKLVEGLVQKHKENKKNGTVTSEDFLRVIYNLPLGFRLTARMTTNYRQLKTIYAQRKNHKLPEWREFCEELKELPHSDWITCEKEDKFDFNSVTSSCCRPISNEVESFYSLYQKNMAENSILPYSPWYDFLESEFGRKENKCE